MAADAAELAAAEVWAAEIVAARGAAEWAVLDLGLAQECFWAVGADVSAGAAWAREDLAAVVVAALLLQL